MRSLLWAAALLLSGLIPTLPSRARDVVKLQTRCYVQQPDQSLSSYPCELRLIYTNPTATSSVPEAVQVKWAYGGLSEFLYNPQRGWQWLEPGSKTWVPASPTWLRTGTVSCYRFGNMCFGRGFPTPEATAAPTAAATPSRPTVTATAQLPSGTASSSQGKDAVRVDEAIACVNALYTALTAQDFATARRYLAGQASSQFEAAFFRQFRQVSANRFRATNDPGPGLTLIASTRYEYRDGSVQVEQRSFRVERSRDGLRIVSSQFLSVLEPRSTPKKVAN